jgi:hypothetical protein
MSHQHPEKQWFLFLFLFLLTNLALATLQEDGKHCTVALRDKCQNNMLIRFCLVISSIFEQKISGAIKTSHARILGVFHKAPF